MTSPAPDAIRTQPTPAALVEGGKFNLGSFASPFDEINPLDADLHRILPLPRAIKNLALKEWQHYALISPRFMLSVVLFDSKRLGLAHVVIYDRSTGDLVKYEKKVPSWQLSIPNSLWNGHAHFERRDMAIDFANQLDRGRHLVEFRCRGGAAKPSASATFTCHEPLEKIEPLVVCLPLSHDRAMYSHKGILPLDGCLTIAGKEHDFARQECFALVDIHKGFYPYVMKWNWTTGGGHNQSGELVGFNLTNNQVRDQSRYNENCLWIDGKRNLLPPVSFTISADQPWRIRDCDGRVDLSFHPEVERKVDVNALVMRSRYRGPFGSFSGYIVDDRGNRVAVDDCYGMGEDFYLRA
jgi:hypothetical protein